MWLEHCYCYFQPVYSAILLKSRKAQVFRYSLLTEYGQDKRLQISNLWWNSFRLLLNFRRRHHLVKENTLIFVTVFITLMKLSELSSQFSSRQRRFSSSSLLTKKNTDTCKYSGCGAYEVKQQASSASTSSEHTDVHLSHWWWLH